MVHNNYILPYITVMYIHCHVYYAQLIYNKVVSNKKIQIYLVHLALYFLHLLGYVKMTFIKDFSIPNNCTSTKLVQIQLWDLLEQLWPSLVQLRGLLENEYLFTNI